MAKYLLEIGCEEIPARFIDGLCRDLEQHTTSLLNDNRIEFGAIKTLATYRRLTLVIDDIATQQRDDVLEIKGPPKRIAVANDGSLLPPALGFAKKASIDASDITFTEIQGQDYCFVKKELKGEKTASVLPELIVNAIRKCSLPIAMRWGSETTPFIRPIHWLVSLLDNDIIPFSLYDIEASNKSFGHRFLTNNPNDGMIASGQEITIANIDNYETELEEKCVMVDQNKRKSLIQTELKKHLDDIDDDLLNEVTHLVEWPTLLNGSFDQKYLELPQEVLIACMKKHQKYFPLLIDGTLQNQFYVAADNVTKSNKNTIIQGNETVLTARLEDTAYFWDEDQKISSQDRVEKLKKVVFQRGLGSIFDKKERLKQIASYLTTALNKKDSENDCLNAVELCKSDLVSHMVYELPELQGTMGRYYLEKEIKAGKSDCSNTVAQAIEEHYWPRFSGDNAPQNSVGAIVSLADRFDTIICCFQNKQIPTGSQDPLGVRRALFGTFKIIIEHGFQCDIPAIIDETYAILAKDETNKDKCLDFIEQRLKGYLQDNSDLDYDIIAAVIPIALKDIKQALHIGKTLQDLKTNQATTFKQLIESGVRTIRITKEHQAGDVNSSIFEAAIEEKTYSAFETCKEQVTTATQNGGQKKIDALVSLSPLLTEYFDDVLIMAKDPEIKENRLRFLSSVRDTFLETFDPSAIVI